MANIQIDEQGTGDTDREPQQIDSGKKSLTPKIPEKEQEVIFPHRVGV